MSTVSEMTVEDARDWKRQRKADKEQFSDEGWKRYRMENYVKVCDCGTPYSYPKTEKDPKACQGCRGEEGELKY